MQLISQVIENDSLKSSEKSVRIVLSFTFNNFDQTLDSYDDDADQTISEYTLLFNNYEEKGMSLFAILEELTKISQISFHDLQIFYRLSRLPLYVFAGVYPLDKSGPYIPAEDLNQQIFIKYRAAPKTKSQEEDGNPKIRRGNEKKLCEVLDALAMWKKIYSYGQNNKDGCLKMYTRQEAAEMVNISKKSLDDYALQVKMAKKYNFDFYSHYNSKFGVVRNFNKKMKAKFDKVD